SSGEGASESGDVKLATFFGVIAVVLWTCPPSGHSAIYSFCASIFGCPSSACAGFQEVDVLEVHQPSSQHCVALRTMRRAVEGN
ncbi:unnamed protein product, partial [Effrenium voratum]